MLVFWRKWGVNHVPQADRNVAHLQILNISGLDKRLLGNSDTVLVPNGDLQTRVAIEQRGSGHPPFSLTPKTPLLSYGALNQPVKREHVLAGGGGCLLSSTPMEYSLELTDFLSYVQAKTSTGQDSLCYYRLNPRSPLNPLDPHSHHLCSLQAADKWCLNTLK